jgi:hypothetical protein
MYLKSRRNHGIWCSTAKHVLNRLGYLSVVMVKPTQDRNCNHLVFHIYRGIWPSRRFRDLLLHPLMRSCLVKVRHICVKNAARVASHGGSAHDQGILAARSSKNARRLHWLVERDKGSQDFNSTCRRHSGETGTKLAIVIAE